MEEEGLLNPNSNVDLYVLHTVFFPRFRLIWTNLGMEGAIIACDLLKRLVRFNANEVKLYTFN